ncbi:hypothetical protein X797_006260 [Metarhizium robertsii]|uniref:Uncharacterized protein n=1 Tax=Metarhizium robertsii TaxID=568076 RepID=A0A014N3X9_9HYPO|nr:hypothetical protein X797_006260 [Metarhizium robertsii]
MVEVKSSRPPQKRTLKPAPLPSTYVESSRSKSEVQFALPADQPQVGKLSSHKQRSASRLTVDAETVRINTCAVSQPLLEPDALQRFG